MNIHVFAEFDKDDSLLAAREAEILTAEGEKVDSIITEKSILLVREPLVFITKLMAS